MRPFVAIFALAFALTACTQQVTFTIDESNATVGKITTKLNLMPHFTSYLKDLDLFAGNQQAEEAEVLPSMFSSALTTLQKLHPNFTHQVNYANGGFDINYSFNYTSFANLFNFDDTALLSTLISARQESNTTTLYLNFTQAMRQEMANQFPLIPSSDGYTPTTYSDELVKTIASSLADRVLVKNELDKSGLTLIFNAPRPVTQVTGGTLSSANPKVVQFSIPLLDILYGQNSFNYSFSY
jgi:hypothetical protein